MTVAYSDILPTLYVVHGQEPRQFSVGQTAQSQTSSIMEKQHTWLDDCLNTYATDML